MNLWSSLREISSRNVRRAGAVVAAATVGLALTAGCLNRPVIEQTPQTSNVFVDQIRQTAIDKIDLLFVIDNSISMADKQAILAVAVPGLVERLVNPDCVQIDEEGTVINRRPAGPDEDNPCVNAMGMAEEGWDIEFKPVDDIHIGVITSSLGGHGGETCTPNGGGAASWNETKNDKGHLLPTVRPDLPMDHPAGFLAWTGEGKDKLKADFQMHVEGAGEIGCGYEATLEAWYRFLIDPSPPVDMVVTNNIASPAVDAEGKVMVDATLLQQRLDFLRPDSLVAIIVLTDENDCSVVDGGIGWLTAATFTLPAQTTQCEMDPNNACCRSCGVTSDDPNCPAIKDDANCIAGRDAETDQLNLRCYNQKQRFGFDLLYPISRYVDGLKEQQIYDNHRCNVEGACDPVQNPLFDPRGASSTRDESLVFFAGIIGVPWQDIATTESLSDPGTLKYKTAKQMVDDNIWEMVLGHPEAPNPTDPINRPADPLMYETSDPRTGMHPVTGEAVASEMSTDPRANSINGHEYINDDDSDLQYACIFPFAGGATRDCTDDANMACDCSATDLPKNRPLCNPPQGGPAGQIQYAAKAYPGTRLLHALRDFGDNSIVASICPKVVDPDTIEGGTANAAFGYNPAVAAIIDRLKEVLGGRCLPRQLVPTDGQVPCAVVEVTLNQLPCEPANGRDVPDPQIIPAVHNQLRSAGSCDGETGTPCTDYFMCEILQLKDEPGAGENGDQYKCLNDKDYTGTRPGYCYIDEKQKIGNASLLVGCPPTERRKLQFVGNDTPAPESITFIACVGAAFSDDLGNAM